MTETTRTTVTLTEYYMEKVEKLVNRYAPTRAQVISKIVENFIDDDNFTLLIQRMNQEREEKERQEALLEARNPESIEKKITNILSGANNIPLNNFLEYLRIDYDFFYDNLSKWKNKYQILVENDVIIKQS